MHDFQRVFRRHHMKPLMEQNPFLNKNNFTTYLQQMLTTIYKVNLSFSLKIIMDFPSSTMGAHEYVVPKSIPV